MSQPPKKDLVLLVDALGQTLRSKEAEAEAPKFVIGDLPLVSPGFFIELAKDLVGFFNNPEFPHSGYPDICHIEVAQVETLAAASEYSATVWCRLIPDPGWYANFGYLATTLAANKGNKFPRKIDFKLAYIDVVGLQSYMLLEMAVRVFQVREKPAGKTVQVLR